MVFEYKKNGGDLQEHHLRTFCNKKNEKSEGAKRKMEEQREKRRIDNEIEKKKLRWSFNSFTF